MTKLVSCPCRCRKHDLSLFLILAETPNLVAGNPALHSGSKVGGDILESVLVSRISSHVLLLHEQC